MVTHNTGRESSTASSDLVQWMLLVPLRDPVHHSVSPSHFRRLSVIIFVNHVLFFSCSYCTHRPSHIHNNACHQNIVAISTCPHAKKAYATHFSHRSLRKCLKINAFTLNTQSMPQKFCVHKKQQNTLIW